jgi:hypothetical protein
LDRLGVCYAAMPRALIVSLSEDVLRRVIDRELARRRDGAVAPAGPDAAERRELAGRACVWFRGSPPPPGAAA